MGARTNAPSSRIPPGVAASTLQLNTTSYGQPLASHTSCRHFKRVLGYSSFATSRYTKHQLHTLTRETCRETSSDMHYKQQRRDSSDIQSDIIQLQSLTGLILSESFTSKGIILPRISLDFHE